MRKKTCPMRVEKNRINPAKQPAEASVTLQRPVEEIVKKARDGRHNNSPGWSAAEPWGRVNHLSSKPRRGDTNIAQGGAQRNPGVGLTIYPLNPGGATQT